MTAAADTGLTLEEIASLADGEDVPVDAMIASSWRMPNTGRPRSSSTGSSIGC